MFSKKIVYVGDVPIGGGYPVVVQTMLWRPLADREGNLKDLLDAVNAGAEIVRVSFPSPDDFEHLVWLVKHSPVPIVADIHYDPHQVILAVDAGVHKIRWNPGTIAVKRVKDALKLIAERKLPIRLGYNMASLPKERIKSGEDIKEAIIRIAREDVDMLNDVGVENIIISIKSSTPNDTIALNKALSQWFDGPIHIGVTEAGTLLDGTIKSSYALGYLLREGIGDTIRVSLSAEPWQEVKVAWKILCASVGQCRGLNIISCPKCARSTGPVWEIAQKIEDKYAHIKKHITVAVMGCAVNGPGEAKDADVGIAFGGSGEAVLFKKGQVYRTFHFDSDADIMKIITTEIDKILEEEV